MAPEDTTGDNGTETAIDLLRLVLAQLEKMEAAGFVIGEAVLGIRAEKDGIEQPSSEGSKW